MALVKKWMYVIAVFEEISDKEMNKIFIFLIVMHLFFKSSLAQVLDGPAYKWELFKNTPVWDLAKAVAEEDTIAIYDLLKKDKSNINFQEPKFGSTLLILALRNDKIKSIEALLRAGGKIDVRELSGEQAIHEASAYLKLKKHSFEALKLLIKYGANVNSVAANSYPSVPIEGTVESLACTKLLLENEASVYYTDPRDSIFHTYGFWFDLLSNGLDSNIYVAKYLIVDKKLKIPNPITVSLAKHEPLDVFYFLNRFNFRGDLKKEKAKQEIVAYLREIDFPRKGVFKP